MTQKMTPKDFAPHLLVVIAEFTEFEPNISVPMSETYRPVCDRMGIDEDFGGMVSGNYKFTHRKIQLAFRQQIREKGLGEQIEKGDWMLTQEGIDEARKIAGDAPAVLEHEDDDTQEEELAAARADATAEVQEQEDDDTDGAEVIQISNAQPRHPYSDDPYIVSLAVKESVCFGAWSKRSDACKGCPIARECLIQVGVRKAEIAAELEAEEAAAVERAAAKARADAKKDESVSELINSFEEDDDAPRGQNGKFKPAPGQDFATAKASRESVCLHCGQKIHKGDEVKWCNDEGIFHIECFDDS
jgi:hypothetical protein